MRASWARTEIIKYYVACMANSNMRTAMLGEALHRFCKTPPVWSSALAKKYCLYLKKVLVAAVMLHAVTGDKLLKWAQLFLSILFQILYICVYGKCTHYCIFYIIKVLYRNISMQRAKINKL